MGEVKAIARLTLRDFSPNFQGFGAGHSRPAYSYARFRFE
jgi:hypothetical protein